MKNKNNNEYYEGRGRIKKEFTNQIKKGLRLKLN